MTPTESSHQFSNQCSDQWQLFLKNVAVHYGKHIAVNNINLALEKGDIGCLLGPSGCGKTSLQRAIAGFEPLINGHIELAGKLVSRPGFSLSPEKRRVGMVFQDFALFPHLSIAKNISFGLRHLTADERQQRVMELLAMVELVEVADRYPHELSGGQQQRIALARAIAPKPDILLLDEPFSSLDATLREIIAKEVRKVLKAHKITAILVTHDQHEAFAIADKIGVMNSGQLIQWDTPYQLYHQPQTPFVANFIGEGKVIQVCANAKGQLENSLGVIANNKQWQAGKNYGVLVRPDDLVYDAKSDKAFVIVDKLFRGAEYMYLLSLPDKQQVLCVTPSHIDLAIGDYLPVTTDLQHLVVFDGGDTL
ncbi:ABC transporter ATP-binding protein [Agarilytica rhodophyticola]|uniref:ABC transporter ATP-binding protein n=1 Tax=Agarilytica rhodophyticola TaxID=1737490 RepID=UPI000B3429A5|nr:ABC transporter ATP-binding protein [Agarilytica rhodophyticola]